MVKATKETLLLDATEDNIKKAGAILRDGGLVAFPTETVYGLGANALSESAVEGVFMAKGRPGDNPLIVHVADLAMVTDLVQTINPLAKRLMNRFWPGPLTIILPKSDIVPDNVTAGLSTVGVRMPSHPVALKLIRESGVPIAAPSANTSGKPSPTRARHVMNDVAGRIDCVLDGGACEVGVESTVLDCTTTPPLILRPGGVTLEELQIEVVDVRYDSSLHDAKIAPRAPGMKYRHYSPKAEVVLIQGESREAIREELKREIAACSTRYAVLGVEDVVSSLPADTLEVAGTWQRPTPIAEIMYDFFRRCDAKAIERIYVHSVPAKGIGVAIMNRLEKAAHRVRHVEEV